MGDIGWRVLGLLLRPEVAMLIAAMCVFVVYLIVGGMAFGAYLVVMKLVVALTPVKQRQYVSVLLPRGDTQLISDHCFSGLHAPGCTKVWCLCECH